MSVSGFDAKTVRTSFPALQTERNGRRNVFFDGPAYSQTPISVIGAISSAYMLSLPGSSNFAVQSRAAELAAQAREAAAQFLNAPDPDCVIFGANVTTLTSTIAAAFGRTLSAGDEIIVTELDHESNRTPWMELAAQGVVLRTAEIDAANGTLSAEAVIKLITPKTRLIAVPLASNITGSLVDIPSISQAAHSVGAAVYADASHYAPHAPLDVQALGCDFVTFGFYKCFGPHLGVLWGKRNSLERLQPPSLSASLDLPSRWEPGAPNHPALAGVPAAVRYLSNIGAQALLTANALPTRSGSALPSMVIHTGMRVIQSYERTLSEQMQQVFALFPEIRVLGLTDPARFDERVPTFSFVWKGKTPQFLMEALDGFNIFCSRGSFYGSPLLSRMGVDPAEGVLRIGLLHYNTPEEITHLQTALESLKK